MLSVLSRSEVGLSRRAAQRRDALDAAFSEMEAAAAAAAAAGWRREVVGFVPVLEAGPGLSPVPVLELLSSFLVE